MLDINDLIGKITCADCMDILKQLPDKCIDLVLTDCPYRIVSGGCTTGTYGNGEGHTPSGMLSKRKIGCGNQAYKWETPGQLENLQNVKAGKLFKFNDIDFEVWLPEVFRVLKDNTHCYIMINARNLAELQTKAENVGFDFQQIIIWDKGNATPNRYYLNAYEMILMLRKGYAKNINNMGTKNILRVSNIIGGKFHPTEKPVELMQILISNSTNENDLVLDPFSGSSLVALACHNLKRRFICIEKDKEYWQKSCERLKAVQAQLTLF